MAPTNNTSERTFIMVKPDGVHRGLVHKVVERFEQRGYKLVATRMAMPTKDLLESHYADLKGKPFFEGLVKYMSEGPVVCFVWEGLDVVIQGRKILGETDPLKSLPGSLRGDFCIQIGRNFCHGSDSVESANKEIALWFKTEELCSWKPCCAKWVYE
eukprot:GHVS01009268.1.p1 GENE.GHVS01009268.1~~GHVS01009268.1.p1  ORF type:complete len:157 (+),score=17.26 GHVS01009268.1:83-553(+)